MLVVNLKKPLLDENGNFIKEGHTYKQYDCFEELNKEAISKATDWVDRNASLYDRFNVNKESSLDDDEKREKRIDRARIGILGELAFELLLNQLGVPYEKDLVAEESNCDSFDFLINGYKIDVKIGNYQSPPKYFFTYGYPEDQCKRQKDFVVVGYLVERRKEIGFYGYIPQKKIMNYKKTKINSSFGYNYFTLNYEFPFGALKTDLEFFLTNTLLDFSINTTDLPIEIIDNEKLSESIEKTDNSLVNNMLEEIKEEIENSSETPSKINEQKKENDLQDYNYLSSKYNSKKDDVKKCIDCGKTLSHGIFNFSMKKYKKPYCMDCQKNH